jgi:acetyltransferase-like isoleucine patch superfamily enzyme
LIPLLRNKILWLRSLLRVYFFRLAGLNIKTGSSLGKITCNWPNKVSIGYASMIEDSVVFKINQPFDAKNSIEIGNNVFVGFNCEFNASAKIIVGDDCLIASFCTFSDNGHSIDNPDLIRNQPCTKQDILIGKNVWIGTHCSILQGVEIGEGSVIGAGSVVNKSIPENQVWAGVPAKFIRNRMTN